MKTKLTVVIIFLIGTMFTSCSNKLVGTWTIQKYETTKPGESAVTLKNIGTMTFQRNGHGEKNVSYTLFGVLKQDNSLFNWTKTNKFISIESKGSDFSKTWILIDNKKTFQKWQSTDGSDMLETLELKR